MPNTRHMCKRRGFKYQLPQLSYEGDVSHRNIKSVTGGVSGVYVVTNGDNYKDCVAAVQ